MNAQTLREALRGIEEGVRVSIQDRNGTRYDISTIAAAHGECVILVSEEEQTEKDNKG